MGTHLLAAADPGPYRRAMHGLTRAWILPDAGEGAAPLKDRVLAARGLHDEQVRRRFLHPRFDDLRDPGDLPGLDEVAGHLVDAVRAQRKVAIYGDYDVDGLTASAILHRVITAAAPGAEPRIHVPHRLDDGYGLSVASLEQLHTEGVEVVVTVDCGVTAVAEAAAARDLGLVLLITDHHALREDGRLPDAVAIAHPGLPGHDYPFPGFSGAGVAWVLARRFAYRWCGEGVISACLQEAIEEALPMAALGTVADVMPLTGENRVLVAAGLGLLPNTLHAGLRALLAECDLVGANGKEAPPIDTEAVAFRLAPRLNAAGRMGDAEKALGLLTAARCDDEAAVTKLDEAAADLTRMNTRRQGIQRSVLAEASEMAEAAGMTETDRRIIVLANPGWHRGVIGIVCANLVDRFGRPTILMEQDGSRCRGSARSIEGYSILDALVAHAPMLTSYGGHSAAAGLEVHVDQLAEFTESITAHANDAIEPGRIDRPPQVVDAEATLPECTLEAIHDLAGMAPFGRGNPEPVLLLRDLVVARAASPMGARSAHLRMRVRPAGAAGSGLRAVWWRQGKHVATLPAGVSLDAIVSPRINRYMGRRSVELHVVDVRLSTAEVTSPSTRPSAARRGP